MCCFQEKKNSQNAKNWKPKWRVIKKFPTLFSSLTKREGTDNFMVYFNKPLKKDNPKVFRDLKNKEKEEEEENHVLYFMKL